VDGYSSWEVEYKYLLSLEILRFLGVKIEVLYTEMKGWQPHPAMLFPEVLKRGAHVAIPYFP
jgi:hypothetical protein